MNSGQYKASREHKNPNSKTSVWNRIKEFPGQHLECVGGQLRCNVYQETLAEKKRIVEEHVKSEAFEWISSFFSYFHLITFCN